MNSIPHNDFLKLTCEFPTNLDTFSFSNEYYDIDVIDTGVIRFTPKMQTSNAESEKAIILSCAVHGNETAPIEICNTLITNMVTGSLHGPHPVLLIFGNPASINIGERFVEENMNRMFERNAKLKDSNAERQRASQLMEYVDEFFNTYQQAQHIHYDLHTAIRDSAHEKFAVYPYLHGKPWKKQQLLWLQAMGVNTFLLMQKGSTTFSYYSSFHHDADAFTIELGKVKPFGQNDQSKFLACQRTLEKLIAGHELNSQFDIHHFNLFMVDKEVNKKTSEFRLTFADDTANFTSFPVGHTLALDGDEAIKTTHEGEAIIFPNANVEIGQRALLTVIPKDVSQQLV
ncbi:succinylglutamate desuccinylase [Bermanella sp. R86510]|uniref:succinylglutamate desuccinylase n=1 Tax=unclassified Bermanella TaxID=2627862 RepID=UPI0037C6B2CA